MTQPQPRNSRSTDVLKHGGTTSEHNTTQYPFQIFHRFWLAQIPDSPITFAISGKMTSTVNRQKIGTTNKTSWGWGCFSSVVFEPFSSWRKGRKIFIAWFAKRKYTNFFLQKRKNNKISTAQRMTYLPFGRTSAWLNISYPGYQRFFLACDEELSPGVGREKKRGSI